MSSLLVTKLDIALAEAQDGGDRSLRRALGPISLVSLGIGAVIGAGIFVLTGAASAQHAGPAVVLSFVLAGFGCAFAGLCYAEFAAMIPVAGSAYTYAYATLGEIFAWIIGWDLILEYAFGAATVASGWSANFAGLLEDLGLHIPPQWTDTPGAVLVFYHGHWTPLAAVGPALATAGVNPVTLPQVTAVFNLVAFLAICAVTAILVLGIKESATLNSAIVLLKIGTVLIFVGTAAAYLWKNPSVALAHWRPFIPENTGQFGSYGWSGIARGAAVVFFAYIGFDAVSTTAQEARNPQRDMPIGILGSLAICTVLYILVAGLMTGVVDYRQLNVAAPVALAMDSTGARGGGFLVRLGTVLGLSTTMLVMLLGQSRVFFAMSRDGLLPAWAGAVHPRWRTPWISTVIVGLSVAFFGASIPIGTLGQLVSIGTLLAFIIVSAGVWILRVKRPDLPRPFRTPLVPAVPIAGILISLFLMASLPRDTWIRLVVWLVIGLGIYFGYGRKRGRLRKHSSPVL